MNVPSYSYIFYPYEQFYSNFSTLAAKLAANNQTYRRTCDAILTAAKSSMHTTQRK